MNCPPAWNRVRQSGSLLRAQPGSLFASSGSNPGSAGKFPGSKKKESRARIHSVTRNEPGGVLSRCFSARKFPCFRVFPRDIDGVIEVQQQALATIEKAEAKKKVVDERCEGTHDDVEHAEAALAFGDYHLGAEGGVTVHMVDVVGEGGVGVVEQGAVERS